MLLRSAIPFFVRLSACKLIHFLIGKLPHFRSATYYMLLLKSRYFLSLFFTLKSENSVQLKHIRLGMGQFSDGCFGDKSVNKNL